MPTHFGERKWADQEFKVILSCPATLRPVWAAGDALSRREEQETEERIHRWEVYGWNVYFLQTHV